MKKRLVFFCFSVCLFISETKAQYYSLEPFNRNKYRDLQIAGNYDSSLSFTNQTNTFNYDTVRTIAWGKPRFAILPLVNYSQFNSHHPFGWNDGGMIQSNGLQFLTRVGVKLNYGIFDVQVAPEILNAFNSKYPTSPLYGNLNNSPINRILPGQSHFRINISPISIGVSTENLWWGPGINSALIMSNNAPGFFHAFIGTKKPIKTAIGSFEFKIIGGRLKSNNIEGFENDHLLLKNINTNWRYLNAYVFSWQPKWIKGLFLGFTRSLQQYEDQAFSNTKGTIQKYFPVISLPVKKDNFARDDSTVTDQLASFFLRWIFPKNKLEFYFEYGKNDYGVNIRDYIMSPSHSGAYTIGVRKLISKNESKYIQLATELTQMSETPDLLVRGASNWYLHRQILQGYTNNNQILGSGVGFGANLFSLSATIINGDFRNGFLFQRIERDPVYKEFKWTDLSIGYMPQYVFKNILISATFQLIRSNNFIWQKSNNPFNFHSRIMLQYNFK